MFNTNKGKQAGVIISSDGKNTKTNVKTHKSSVYIPTNRKRENIINGICRLVCPNDRLRYDHHIVCGLVNISAIPPPALLVAPTAGHTNRLEAPIFSGGLCGLNTLSILQPFDETLFTSLVLPCEGGKCLDLYVFYLSK